MTIKTLCTTLFIASLAFACTHSSQTDPILQLSNPNDIVVSNRVISYNLDSIYTHHPALRETSFIAMAGEQEIPYQIGQSPTTGEPELLLLIPSISARDTLRVTLRQGSPTPIDTMVAGRVHKERDDDFAWENNRNGYRVFGPALEAKGEVSSGVDYFSKRTDKIVLDEWFKAEIEKPHSYHIDRGEGMDFYMVGPSLGFGGSAPINEDTLCFSRNYTTVKIIEEGPIRMMFELTYKPYPVGNKSVSEKRVIVCDAYSYFNHHYVTYTYDGNDSIDVGVGFTTRKDAPEPNYQDINGCLAYAQPEVDDKGVIFSGAVAPNGFSRIITYPIELVGVLQTVSGQPIDYLSGGNWSHADFSTFEEWKAFMMEELMYQQNPIKVELIQ